MRRAHRVTKPWAIVALVVLAAASAVSVAALWGSPAQPALPAAPWAVGGPLVAANLSVTRCPTSFGARGARANHLPARIRVAVSQSLRSDVAMFTDGEGTLDVLAPAAWQCTALDAVDGSSTLVVYPPGAPRPIWGHVTRVREGIVASQTGSCVGCSLETACPLFPAARRSYTAAYGISCPKAPAGLELRTDVSASRVLFIDPPGVLGAGLPSGGGLAAYGAMLWRIPGSRAATAWRDTCTLPSVDHDLCVLSVRGFLARHPAS